MRCGGHISEKWISATVYTVGLIELRDCLSEELFQDLNEVFHLEVGNIS